MIATKGEVTQEHDGALWVTACLFHRGEEPIGEEPLLTEDGHPVWATENGVPVRDQRGEYVPAVIPIYSEKVGFQPDCPACQLQLLHLNQHLLAIEGDRLQGEWEFEQELERRGMRT